jgi:ankyrin repeat protein
MDDRDRERKEQYLSGQEGELISAVKYNQFVTARRLVEKGARLNKPDRKGKTPLDYAVASQFPKLVELMLAKGAKANGLIGQKRVPLHWAAIAGQRKSIRLLLDHGADPKKTDEDGMTAAALALCAGYSECLASTLGDLDTAGGMLLYALLLEDQTEFEKQLSSLDPNEFLMGVFPLAVATLLKNKGAVDSLLKAGADPNQGLANGTTCLLVAVSFSTTPIGRMLLKAGASPNAVNKKDHFALGMSYYNRSLSWAKLLIKAGAKPNQKQRKYLEDIALDYSAQSANAGGSPNSKGKKLLDLYYETFG